MPFGVTDWHLLYKLLRNVRYFDAEENRGGNFECQRRGSCSITGCRLGLNRVIYMQVHDAGSSSGVMLNLLVTPKNWNGRLPIH